MTDRPIRVCLIQHSTRSDNLGVGALTVSEVEILRDVGRRLGRKIEIEILDRRLRRQPYVSGSDIRVTDLTRSTLLDPRGCLRTFRASDLVIDIGAGDSFADIYGTGRINRMFLLKALVHLSGTPLVMAPQTIGPFTRRLSRRLARATLRRSAIVASRDRLSTTAARSLGASDVLETSDVALRLPYDPPPPRPAGGPVRIGLNVSGLLMQGGYSGRNEFGLKADYPTLVHALLELFRAEGSEVHLVPHVFPAAAPPHGAAPASEDDHHASARLAGERGDVILAPHFATPSEAKSYIAGMDFFLGARMHACIAALSSGVPVIPMAYSRKFEGLFGSIGYTHTVDCTTMGQEEIVSKVRTGLNARDTLAREAVLARDVGLEKLARYEDALVNLIRDKFG